MPQQIDASFMAWFQQMVSQYYANPNMTGALTNYDPLHPELNSTGSSQQVNNSQQNQAYLMEIVRMEIATVIRNAQILNKSVADYSIFQDPSMITLGPGVQVLNPQNNKQTLSYTDASGTVHTAPVEKMINLELFQLLISKDDPKTPAIEGKRFEFINRITGNGMVIDGDMINTVIDGKVTASKKLSEVLKIDKDHKTGTINLETGIKITFSFDTPDGQEPTLQKMTITHPDGSYAELSDLQNNTDPLKVATGQQFPGIAEYLDQSLPDGHSLFMGPEGSSLFALNKDTGKFEGEFGDDRALSAGLNSASFGGNLINFFWSESDQGWHAMPILPEFLSVPPNGPGIPGIPGFPGMPGFPGDMPPGWTPPPGWSGSPGTSGPGAGTTPPDCNLPAGYFPPPYFQNRLANGASVEDLIFEDLTGVDKSGKLQQMKKSFLQCELKYGKLDMETKLFIVLYLFLDDNDQKTEKILEELSGVDKDLNQVNKKPKGYWNVNNIDKADTKTQMDFWSNYQPPGLSTNQATRTEQLQANATKVNGKMQGLQIDQSLQTTRLTNLVRDRQRFVEEIANIMKSIDDALANAVRRIV